MKIKTLLLAVALVCAGITSDAQTNTAPQTASPGSITADLTQLLKDDYAFFGTNTQVTVDIGALYSDHQWGGLLDIHAPLPIGTNAQVSAGLSTAFLDHTLYSASLSIKGGKTITVPILKAINLWAETGPGYNFRTHSAILQSFAGGTWGFDVTKGFKLYISGMSGDISDRPGIAYGGALSFTLTPGKW